MGEIKIYGKPQSAYTLNEDNEPIERLSSGYYKNEDAVESVLRYITRTRMEEKRLSELLFWGAYGASAYDLDLLISQFEYVQQQMRSSTTRKLYHISYNFDKVEFLHLINDRNLLFKLAAAQASIFYRLGHQVAYAVHLKGEDNLHVHFAINSVNFCTGKMFRLPLNSDKLLNEEMVFISYSCIAETKGLLFPFERCYQSPSPWIKSEISPVEDRKESRLHNSEPFFLIDFEKYHNLTPGTVIINTS